jgi:hypothetical protein
MKKLAGFILCASLAASAQSPDYSEQQREMYEAGQKMGNAIGLLILRARIAHTVHKLRDQQCRAGGIGYHWAVEITSPDLGTGEWEGDCTAKQAGVKLAPTVKEKTKRAEAKPAPTPTPAPKPAAAPAQASNDDLNPSRREVCAGCGEGLHGESSRVDPVPGELERAHRLHGDACQSKPSADAAGLRGGI